MGWVAGEDRWLKELEGWAWKDLLRREGKEWKDSVTDEKLSLVTDWDGIYECNAGRQTDENRATTDSSKGKLGQCGAWKGVDGLCMSGIWREDCPGWKQT